MRATFSALLCGCLASVVSASACHRDTSSSSEGSSGTNDPTGSSGSTGGPPGTGASSSSSSSSSGGSSSSSSSSSGDPGVVAVDYTHFDVNHVLITGQSNSVSNSGTPVLSTTQPYGNVMFNTGVMPARGSIKSPTGASCDGNGCVSYDTPTSFVPLIEGDKFFGYAVETSAAGLANQVSFLATTKYQGTKNLPVPAKHDVLVSIHGRSGNTYWCLRKGGCNYKPGYLSPFDQGMKEVASGHALALAANKSYVVRAVTAIHGESDHYSYTDGDEEFPLPGSDGTPNKIQSYADAMIEWQQDYETSIKEITKQTLPVPLFLSQISGWNDAPTSRVAQFELDAHVRAPGKVVLIGPSYNLPLDQDDCLHFTNEGERRLGEYFAKVYSRVVFEGKPWEPVRPKSVTRLGAAITVVFHVPVPPLAIDTDRVAAAANYGFAYVPAAGAAASTITNVAVTGPDTVTITLDSAPANGAAGHLTYAQNQTPLTCIGTPRGARGNLRDSDTTPSKLGYDLHNWSVHFDVEVP